MDGSSETKPVKAYARVHTGGRVRRWVNFDSNSFEKPGFFQRLPSAQNGVADDGVVLLIESWRQSLNDGLLGEKLE